MKNQYFGDINDFRKYGVLRSFNNLRILTCWMLTENDQRNDGKFTYYLLRKKNYRHFDSSLFDSLQDCLQSGYRNTAACAQYSLIPNAVYFDKELTNDLLTRSFYFSQIYECAPDFDLIFLDPDNGMEIKSVKKGNKNSSKYLFYDEIKTLYSRGSSLLIYQHFIRENRLSFIDRITGKLIDCTGCADIFSLRTSKVVFFLLSQPSIKSYFSEKLEQINNTWKGEIICRQLNPNPISYSSNHAV